MCIPIVHERMFFYFLMSFLHILYRSNFIIRVLRSLRLALGIFILLKHPEKGIILIYHKKYFITLHNNYNGFTTCLILFVTVCRYVID